MSSKKAKCRKILIVEDDSDIRSTLEDVLECEGFETVTARNGCEAVSVLQEEEEPMLVFLDLMMPKMNGWEVLDQRELISGHRVVTMSCLDSTASLEDPTPLPVEACLKKPVDLNHLLQVAHQFASPAESRLEAVGS